MIVLAFDTAGVDCSVAVYDGEAGRMLAARTERLGKGHAERLMGLIDETLADAGVDLHSIGRIGVTTGPGSFTGIRTGVAAARGLSLALGIPAAGVSTLEVLAAAFHEIYAGETVLAAIDAKRGEIYAQVFDGTGKAMTEPAAMTAAEAQALAERHHASITGSAAPLLSGGETGGEADHFPPGLAARLAIAVTNPVKPKPMYLRAPDAKPQTGFALTRT